MIAGCEPCRSLDDAQIRSAFHQEIVENMLNTCAQLDSQREELTHLLQGRALAAMDEPERNEVFTRIRTIGRVINDCITVIQECVAQKPVPVPTGIPDMKY